MEIFTIGHSNYSMERFLHMLRYFNINCIVDIRGTPYSKYNVQFDKESLKYTLNKEGFVYIYMAKEFAAKRENKVSYNKEGYSDFEKVVKEEDFINGIERLKNGCKKFIHFSTDMVYDGFKGNYNEEEANPLSNLIYGTVTCTRSPSHDGGK